MSAKLNFSNSMLHFNQLLKNFYYLGENPDLGNRTLGIKNINHTFVVHKIR